MIHNWNNKQLNLSFIIFRNWFLDSISNIIESFRNSFALFFFFNINDHQMKTKMFFFNDHYFKYQGDVLNQAFGDFKVLITTKTLNNLSYWACRFPFCKSNDWMSKVKSEFITSCLNRVICIWSVSVSQLQNSVVYFTSQQVNSCF